MLFVWLSRPLLESVTPKGKFDLELEFQRTSVRLTPLELPSYPALDQTLGNYRRAGKVKSFLSESKLQPKLTTPGFDMTRLPDGNSLFW